MLNSFSAPLNGKLSIPYPAEGASSFVRFAPVAGATYLVQQFQALQQVQAVPAPTYDIYVSSINGDDSRDGSSPAKAKKTITGLTGAATLLANGKSLGLECGSHFREMLTITQKDVRVGAYVGPANSQALPILDASDPLTASSDPSTGFIPSPGNPGLFQFNKPYIYLGEGRDYPYSIFETGVGFEQGIRLKRVLNLTDCRNNAGTFFIDPVQVRRESPPVSHPPFTIYFNPIDAGHSFEVAMRDAGVDVAPSATGLRLSRIHAKRSLLNDGVMRLNAKGAVVTDCVAEDGTKHTLYVTDGCLLENVTCWKGEGIDSYFIYYYDNSGLNSPDVAGDSVGTTFRRCAAIGGYPYKSEVIVNEELQNPAYEKASGFYCHSAALPNPQLASVTYEGCYAENLGSGFGGEAQLITTRNCYTYKVATCAAGASYAGQIVTIEGNTFDQRAGEDYQKAQNERRTILSISANNVHVRLQGNPDIINYPYAGGTTNIERNVLLMSQAKYGFFLYANGPVGYDVIINFNYNTLYSESNKSNGLSKHGTGLLTFTHNVFYNPEQILYYPANTTPNPENPALDTTTRAVSSDNVYYHQGKPLTWLLGSATKSPLSDWQTVELPTSDPDYKSYQDARSVLAAPLFPHPVR